MDIVEFLTARLDEDERIAQKAIDEQARRIAGSGLSDPENPAVWEHSTDDSPEWGWRRGVLTGGIFLAYAPDPDLDRGTPEHIARHDPARVLADVAAKRAIMDFWSRAYQNPRDHHIYDGFEWDKVRRNAQWTLRRLAQPYADHPDFGPSWRIETPVR